MRILHTVEFYQPSTGGAQEVVRQISERLARRGHDVTVATTALPERGCTRIDGVEIAEFEVAGSEAGGMRGDVEGYRRFVTGGDFDVVLCYAAQQWATDALIPVFDRLGGARLLAPCGFSGLHQRGYGGYFRRLREVLPRLDHVVLASAAYRDAAFCRRHGVTRWSVIPNGAGGEEFAAPDPTFRERYAIPPDCRLVLTVGTHTGAKGHDLCIDAFAKAELGDAVLVVIGNSSGGGGCERDCAERAAGVARRSGGRKRVLLLDPPRADVVAAFFAADVFVLGSRIECSPLVLFEAMAAGTPFLTVDCGNAAEIAERSGGGLVVETRHTWTGESRGSRRSMARLLARLCGEPDLAGGLGRAGRAAWKASFTWEHIAEQYENLYRAVLAGGRRSVPASARVSDGRA